MCSVETVYRNYLEGQGRGLPHFTRTIVPMSIKIKYDSALKLYTKQPNNSKSRWTEVCCRGCNILQFHPFWCVLIFRLPVASHSVRSISTSSACCSQASSVSFLLCCHQSILLVLFLIVWSSLSTQPTTCCLSSHYHMPRPYSNWGMQFIISVAF